jgi:internalin A
MKLKELHLQWAGVADLSPLKGMTSLKHLDLLANGVSDLSPLKGLRLDALCLQSCGKVKDLAPLCELKSLRQLDVGDLTIPLSPLAGMPLEYIRCRTTEGNVEVLRTMKQLRFINGGPAAKVLEKDTKKAEKKQ